MKKTMKFDDNYNKLLYTV